MIIKLIISKYHDWHEEKNIRKIFFFKIRVYKIFLEYFYLRRIFIKYCECIFVIEIFLYYTFKYIKRFSHFFIFLFPVNVYNFLAHISQICFVISETVRCDVLNVLKIEVRFLYFVMFRFTFIVNTLPL